MEAKLKWSDLIKGGELVYVMGNTPNEKWGVEP